MNVCMYLRKSRADMEAEARGEGETLVKHKVALHKVAQEKNLHIAKIREEIVSGESLAHRPEMMQLLNEVENQEYDAVLCMDMDRLGRGNMQEQGLILDTFRGSNTKIITPRKVYDLNNEWDEEYSEFESFMARRELKLITRRMQRGRLASVEAGNYIGSIAPYGYRKVKTPDNQATLEPSEEEATVVQMIYKLYVQERKGTGIIARTLNELGIPTRKNSKWTVSTVRDMLQNPVYIGKVKWNTRPEVKSRTTKSRPRARPETWLLTEGKHPPLITEETFTKAQAIFESRRNVRSPNGKITNPLAGLIICGKCHAKMIRRPYARQAAHLICSSPACKNKSVQFKYVEEKLLRSLEVWLEGYQPLLAHRQIVQQKQPDSANQQLLHLLEREQIELNRQQDRLYELLERGVYSDAVFLERTNSIAERLNKNKAGIEQVKAAIRNETQRQQASLLQIKAFQSIIDGYKQADNCEQKNKLLKCVLNYAIYNKEKFQRLDDFELTVYPALPYLEQNKAKQKGN